MNPSTEKTSLLPTSGFQRPPAPRPSKKEEAAEILKKEDKLLAKPRSLLQKFLFSLVGCIQVIIVYMVTYDIDYGVPAFKCTGPALKLEYCLLIVAASALSILSFFSTCILTPGTDLYSAVVLGLDSAFTAVSTALVNAVGATWGPSGDLLTLLKYLIQYQIFICYINVGFTFVFSQHLTLPDWINHIFDWVDHIDEIINACLAPIVHAFAFLWYIISAPFVWLYESIKFLVVWSLWPFRFLIAHLIVGVGKVVHAIGDGFTWSFNAVISAIQSICAGIRYCFEQIWRGMCIAWTGVVYVWEKCVVFPAVYLWQDIICASVLWCGSQFAICGTFVNVMQRFWNHVLKFCYAVEVNEERQLLLMQSSIVDWSLSRSKEVEEIVGWIEKKGHFRHNWTKRFFILRNGIFAYFGKMGDKYPPQGADLKGTLQLRFYTSAVLCADNPNQITLYSTDEGSKDYMIRQPTPDDARRLADSLNKHIEWIKEEDRKDAEVMRLSTV